MFSVTPPQPVYSPLGLYPVTDGKPLSQGVQYIVRWSGTGSANSYSVDLVKGDFGIPVANLGTAYGSQKSFTFTIPAGTSGGSDYRLLFGGKGGELTDMFSVTPIN